MSAEDGIEFTLPPTIRDYIFDLHDAVRRSRIPEEISKLYEVKLKEINDKYFAQSHWPDSKLIAGEVYNDELFLAIYREMATRHITTKLKPQLADHLASWQNYKKLFDLIIGAKDDFSLTTQWIYDITQEFAYQFQGFCQFRCQIGSHNADTTATLKANKDAWNLPEVLSLLQRLIRAGKMEATPSSTISSQSPMPQQFAYFATIELARLECLMGDHSASLLTISRVGLFDRGELFTTLPICQFNVLYHVGVCEMLLKNYFNALDVFSDIILYVLRVLKPGAGYTLRPGVPQALQRMLDKALSLTAILLVLTPTYPVEDQVKEAVEAKCEDKMRRLRGGDRSAASELFENNCPKFISPIVPDYSSLNNLHHAVFEQQVKVFVEEVQQHLSFFKLRSFLSMYASVDVQKLARFMEMNEQDMISLLLSFKNKQAQQKQSAVVAGGRQKHVVQDIQFTIEGGVLVVEAAPSKSAQMTYERYFISGVKKHEEIMKSLNKTFATLGL